MGACGAKEVTAVDDPAGFGAFFHVRFFVAAGDAREVFITCKGQCDPQIVGHDGQEYFMSFNDASGNGTFVTPTTLTMDYLKYAYPLSHFPLGGTSPDKNYRIINVPRGRSMRIFVSLKNKLLFQLTQGAGSSVSIGEPDQLDRAYNAETIFDKFEITFLTADKAAFVNTTAVDGVGLPLSLQEPTGPRKTPLGFTTSRTDVMKHLVTTLGSDNTWAKLFYHEVDASRVVRVFSPTVATDHHLLDSTYLDDYIQFVWWWFAQAGNVLSVDCKEVQKWNPGLKSYIFSSDPAKSTFSKDDPAKSQLVFTDGIDAVEIRVDLPTTSDVWGCQGRLDTPNQTLRSVVNKNLAACLNRALLPSAVPGPITGDWYHKPNVSNKFYTNNELFVSPAENKFNYPKVLAHTKYYNYYSKCVHEVASGGLYGFAYDDVGGRDSTLSGDGVKFAEVTLQDIAGTVIPANPNPPKSTYDVQFAPAARMTGYYVLNGKQVEMDASKTVELDNEFRIVYGPCGTTGKEHSMNINERTFDGLAVGLEFSHAGGQTVVHLGLPAVSAAASPSRRGGA